MDDVDREAAGARRVEDADEAATGSNLVGLAVLVGLLAFLGTVSVPALVFVLALVGVVFLHELGHFVTARVTGMKATEFFLGFGPRIFSFRRGETTYGVKAIWAGAYVRILGMNGLEEVDPVEEHRAYRAHPTRHQVLVASAGSLMHFAVALTLLVAIFAFHGRTTVDEDEWSFGRVLDGGAADEAGLLAGDRPLSIDGVATPSWEDLVAAVSSRPGETVDVVVDRGGQQLVVPVELGADGDQGLLGVSYSDVIVTEVGVLQLVPAAVDEFVDLGVGSVQGVAGFFQPSNLADFAGRVFTAPGQDDPLDNPESRPVSVVGIVQIGADVAETSIWDAIYLFALFNIFIGIFNLAPLPPLDGGHIVVSLYERLRSRRGADRHRIDYERLLPVVYGVFAVLVVFGVGALWLDLANPLN